MTRSPPSNKQQQLVAALLESHCGQPAARRARLVETHISWVLLAGKFAYKIKKAVELGFLDFTSLDSRRYYCEEEIRLNRRLAPQLYLETVAIGGTYASPVIGQTPALEYAVKMRRFAPDNLFDKLIARNKITPDHIDQLAVLLARFHHGLPPAPPGSAHGSPDNVRAAALQNFAQMLPLLPDGADRKQLTEIENLTRAEFAAHEQDIAARHAQGCIRECHGDLHLGNIALIRDQPVPFDGIEFNAELRWEDVMSEVAFPVMDLLQHEQPALAHRLLNAWLEAIGEYPGICVLRFYLAYRAMVRAKINAIRASQPALPARARNRMLAACRSYMALAKHTLTVQLPALIITHGLPGSGKTTFAQQALERFGAIRIRSDVERKRLFGLGPLEDSRSGTDIYTQDATQHTYEKLQEHARTILAAGYPVIVDAAFLRRDERAAFRQLADKMKVPFAIASLQAPSAILHARIIQRRADASEADIAVLNMLQKVQEPLSAEETSHCAKFTVTENQPGYTPAQWARLEQLIAGRNEHRAEV